MSTDKELRADAADEARRDALERAHKQLKVSEAVALLKDCAFEYAHQRASLRSAVDCAAPLEVIRSLQANLAAALEDLTDAAQGYYDDVYDGSKE